MRSPSSRNPAPHADAVGVIVALLERYPQIATINSDPLDRSVTFSFAIAGTIDKTLERDLRESIADHVRALVAIGRDEPDRLTIDVDADDELSFVRITRDARSLSREELAMVTSLLDARLRERLVQSAGAGSDADDDASAQDEIVEYALDALRDLSSQRSLVGFREEMRVMVYVVKARKKSKARARN